MKIKLIQLDTILLCLTFYEITVLPHEVYLGFKYIVVAYIFIRHFMTIKKIPYLIIPVALYGGVNVLSTVINHASQNMMIASFVFAVQIIDIFILTENFLSQNPIEKYIGTIFGVFVTLIVLTDSLMLVKHYNFHNPAENYLIGNKFVVSYVHCFASGLAFMLSYKTEKVISLNNGVIRFNGMSMRLFAFLFSAFSILICRRVTCSTGMLVCLLLFVLMLMPAIVQRVISNGKIMLIVSGVLNFLLLGSYGIMNNSFIHNFVYGYLEKSTTWNGRLIIWGDIFRLISKKLIFGYGFYTDIVAKELGFGNPQNAVLKFLIDVGVVGLVLYAVIVWMSFKPKSAVSLHRIYPMVAFFYAMIFAALVEINLTHMIVFMSMAIAYSAAKYSERSLA